MLLRNLNVHIFHILAAIIGMLFSDFLLQIPRLFFTSLASGTLYNKSLKVVARLFTESYPQFASVWALGRAGRLVGWSHPSMQSLHTVLQQACSRTSLADA